ncbi:P30 dbc protein [Clonorchis sinensis]|uniref:p30 dbc protein n=1 Tax=Clonorchis sinensis TaxID=79923 RepID=H2KTK7_CLOSI|nr:P30 dbc protein [Clonorchis sinensis]
MEEQKEQSFEVSSFYEQFREVHQRDCTFTSFTTINTASKKDHTSEQDEKPKNGTDTQEERAPSVPYVRKRLLEAKEFTSAECVAKVRTLSTLSVF